MKINESNRIGATNPYAKQNELRAETAKKAKKKDEVQISAAAQEMLTTSKLNSSERAERINQLKQSVASGTYHVDAGKIAEKLLPFLTNNRPQ
ncbi:flagellar biosynthesis anti-sigma factor FlgM [Paenibacillus nanensis]|uniref:Negative regulator of flagellin synthesis n=1 Tax=Paenibacillus nanensis TaxID=393251 RepID=A0A3A1UJG9_9BACL|nr:flagellar biosynthesis anti-sigma factor FlgM [Paenibacillus nanensis]RIX47293.1 flagellar biosynthesis anti-sigma factor FlgM [Paenibacillus nanensis]